MPSKEKIRVKLYKKEEIRFISHLDMVRTFTRALRRARLPVALSAGFIPREKISFNFPLPLGLTSKCEYVDIKLANFIRPDLLREKLNRELPSGLRVEEARIIPLESKSLMATFNCAEYEVKLLRSADTLSINQAKIKQFLKQRRIIIKREKKRTEEIDIRPFILKMEVKDSIDTS